jgi:carbonic anhydrase
MKILFAGFLISGGCLASEHAHPHWSYSGETAPSHWSELESDFAACSRGHAQSPIDIRHEAVHYAKLPKLVFDYHAVPLKIIDNGHTIQIDYAPGSFLTVGDKRYQLVQFHFHHPSEELLDGKSFEMVAHLVHKDAEGTLAVLAVLLDRGNANPLVQALWAHIPKQKQHEDTFADNINVADLLPKDHSYYSFSGSLTTPPCTEGVSWFVLRHPNSVSPTQVKAFARRYPMNARPVQPVNGREISASQE